MDNRPERRLTAILSADVAGYSALVAVEEEATLARFSATFRDLIRPAVEENGGRVVKTMGDGVLAAFPSVAGALRCAVRIQDALAEPEAADQALAFRIGVHVADVVVEDGDILGDGVNVAARLQALADAGGICVSDRAREDVQGRLDVEFEDLGPQQLKNIPRAVRAWRVRLGHAPVVRKTLQVPTKPSIVVLPFENRTGDPEQEYFADAVTEDIVTALSRWRWFFVIGRNSSFALKGRSVDPGEIGRELGVRYILQGSVRKSGSRVRLSAQLIEAATSASIWAEHYDRDLIDILALQDEITEHVVGAIEPAMLHSEGARTTRKNLADLDALDCFQRGMWHLNKVSEEGCRVAMSFFRQSIERDPELALGHIGLARALYGRAIYAWSQDPEGDLAASLAFGRTAIRLDPRDAYGYFAASGASLYLGRHREALDDAQRTVALNPNLAFGHFRLGQVLLYSGRASEAIGPIERSLRYSPYDPQQGAMLSLLALAHFHAGDCAEAARHAESAAALLDPRATGIRAACLVRMGRLEEARAALASLQAQGGAVRRGSLAPYARPADRYELVEALAEAGVPGVLLASV